MANKFTDFNPGIVNNSRKNFIINGATRIWQRGTAAVNIAASNAAYLADHFRAINATDGTLSYTRGTSNSPSSTFREYIWLSTNVVDTSLSAAQTVGIQCVIEGYDILPLIGKTCTLSFWAWAAVAGTYCVSFTNYSEGNTDRSYVAEYTLSAGSSFEYKTITFTMHDLLSGSNWNTTNGGGLRIWWSYGSGSNFNTTPNTWQTGNYVGTSNQVNLMGNVSYGLGITGIQLELGSIATPFETRSFSEELALCQRYYEKSYEYSTAIGTVTQNGMTHGIRGSGSQCSMVYYKVPKRISSTPILYSPATGTAGQCRNYNSGADQAASAASVSEKSFNVGNGSASVSDIYGTHWVSDADFN
jgi:hypothetical protein